MKYVKTLGLLTVIAAALAAFAVTASATTLTDKTNAAAPYEGHIHAVAGKATWKGPLGEVSCTSAGMTAKVKSKGGPNENETVVLELVTTSFSGCGSNDVTVAAGDVFEIHTDKPGTNDGNGTVTYGKGKQTIQYTALGISCVYEALEPTSAHSTAAGKQSTGNTRQQ